MRRSLVFGVLALVLVLLTEQPVRTAYVTATVRANAPMGDGRYLLAVEFSGNAGEPVVRKDYIVGRTTTLTDLRQWAIGEAAGLDSARALASVVGLQPGQSVSLAAITPPALTAEQTWRRNLSRLMELRARQSAGVTAYDAEIAALVVTVNTTAQPGW